MPQLLAAAPDKVLAFVVSIEDPAAPRPADGSHVVTYQCPMHPDVTSSEPGHCPRCGMKLLQSEAELVGQAGPEAPHHHAPGDEMHVSDSTAVPADLAGIEWEDDMVEMNRRLTSKLVHWRVVDRTDGTDNADIDWQFHVGDRVKIRLVNEGASDHPMHHPFHIHGAGRFLVLSRDGVTEQNLVWKDTVLIRLGQTVDVLLDVTQPGRWMAHCHIAEHMQSGMMFSFTVV
jgi:FtsP/CotA-like multicopper oxidase with cupredoxin domain